MASTINTTNIDTTYPIAGQDNDSQGFRDNFTNINTNFEAAKEELEDLQDKVILKAPLIGSTLDNDMAGTLIKAAQIEDFRGTVLTTGNVSGAVSINVATAPYQKITPTAPITLSFPAGGWPAVGHGAVQVEIQIDSTAYTVTLPAEVTIGTDGLQDIVGQVITFPSTGKFILEFSSATTGTEIAVNDLTQGRYTATSGLNDIVEDLTPQLGGDLDVLTQIITTSTVNGDIAITPDGSGAVVLDGLRWPIADGTIGQYIETDGVGNLTWASVTAPPEVAGTYGTTGAIALDISANTYFYPTGTTTGIITFSFNNPAAAGTVTAFTMELLGAGDNAPVWPASVDWPAATEPTWTAGGTDIVSFITRDNGTTWLGMLGGLAFA